MIDKGILKGFGMILIIVGIVGTFFVTTFLIAIINGTVANTVNENRIDYTATGVAFLATNESDQSLGRGNIVQNSFRIYDENNINYSESNFTIDYTNGLIRLK